MSAVNVRSLRSGTRLSQEQFAQLLGTSWITVSRWERGVAEPNPKTEARLRRLKELLRHIGNALVADELLHFLQTAHPLLRGYRPVQLLESDYSFEDLLAFVEAAKSGDMA